MKAFSVSSLVWLTVIKVIKSPVSLFLFFSSFNLFPKDSSDQIKT